jgi:hypothetical protein
VLNQQKLADRGVGIAAWLRTENISAEPPTSGTLDAKKFSRPHV